MKLTIVGRAFSPDAPAGHGLHDGELNVKIEVDVAGGRLVGTFTNVARPDVPVPFDIDAGVWRAVIDPPRAALVAPHEEGGS